MDVLFLGDDLALGSLFVDTEQLLPEKQDSYKAQSTDQTLEGFDVSDAVPLNTSVELQPTGVGNKRIRARYLQDNYS